MASPRPPVSRTSIAHREILIVFLLTLFGTLIRLWRVGQSGLTHFDEGIYAIAGLWAVSPRSLAGLDPTIVSYAPGGFPIQVGFAYLGLGVSDVAAILPSVLAGTITIPVVGWLAHRTFGTGAGAPAAALAALSGFHVAFSRMALTDASFLLVWTLALIVGQRFMERPRAARGVALGLCVGLAQWFKYNGWLAGVAVPAAACLGMAIDPAERQGERLRAIWGGGLLAALVAAVVYWPWFRFVESNGGYAALLRHQRGYLGGLASWFPHWNLQLDQAAVLSGGMVWNLAGAVTACLAVVLTGPGRASAGTRFRGALPMLALAGVLTVAPSFAWWLGIPWLLSRWKVAAPGERLLQVAWAGLSILTPFYHPYARLWLPLLSIGWVVAGGGLAWLTGWGQGGATASRGLILATFACVVLAVLQGLPILRSASDTDFPGPIASTSRPSIRVAVNEILRNLPAGVSGLRVLARPTVTFALGGRVPAMVEADLEHLLTSGDGRAWALVDVVQLMQGGDLEAARRRLLERWELVGEYPTAISLPTLLDVDPGTARGNRSAVADAPLLLLRPRTRGNLP